VRLEKQEAAIMAGRRARARLEKTGPDLTRAFDLTTTHNACSMADSLGDNIAVIVHGAGAITRRARHSSKRRGL
jgi:hypothetical protein